MLISLIYIAVGLALTSNCIDILSDYLKQLHYFGRKLGNLGNIAIWFGADKVTVGGLLEEYADANNLRPPDENELQKLVRATIAAQKEGKNRKAAKPIEGERKHKVEVVAIPIEMLQQHEPRIQSQEVKDFVRTNSLTESEQESQSGSKHFADGDREPNDQALTIGTQNEQSAHKNRESGWKPMIQTQNTGTQCEIEIFVHRDSQTEWEPKDEPQNTQYEMEQFGQKDSQTQSEPNQTRNTGTQSEINNFTDKETQSEIIQTHTSTQSEITQSDQETQCEESEKSQTSGSQISTPEPKRKSSLQTKRKQILDPDHYLVPIGSKEEIGQKRLRYKNDATKRYKSFEKEWERHKIPGSGTSRRHSTVDHL